MSEGLLYFLLGALVSIPVAIFAPFGTKQLEQWRAKSSANKAVKVREGLLSEVARIRELAEHRSLLTGYLVSAVLRVTLLTLLGGAFGGLSGAVGSLLYVVHYRIIGGYVPSETLAGILTAAGGFVNVIVLLLAIPIASRALGARVRSQNYDAYIKNVESQLASIGADPLPGELTSSIEEKAF
jgi:hypothetical protein